MPAAVQQLLSSSPFKYHHSTVANPVSVLFGIIPRDGYPTYTFLFFASIIFPPHFSKGDPKRSAGILRVIAAVAGSRCDTDFGAAPPFLVFIIALSQEKSMVKTVGILQNCGTAYFFFVFVLSFRRHLPLPPVSQGHRSVPFLFAVSDRQPSFSTRSKAQLTCDFVFHFLLLRPMFQINFLLPCHFFYTPFLCIFALSRV